MDNYKLIQEYSKTSSTIQLYNTLEKTSLDPFIPVSAWWAAHVLKTVGKNIPEVRKGIKEGDTKKSLKSALYALLGLSVAGVVGASIVKGIGRSARMTAIAAKLTRAGKTKAVKTLSKKLSAAQVAGHPLRQYLIKNKKTPQANLSDDIMNKMYLGPEMWLGAKAGVSKNPRLANLPEAIAKPFENKRLRSIINKATSMKVAAPVLAAEVAAPMLLKNKE